MKILFLDFDGVLNSVQWYERRKDSWGEIPTTFLQRSQNELDHDAVKLVSNFANETNASVVVSSSWRILHPIEELREVVATCGWNARPFVDITPRSKNGFRGDEIKAWLTDPTKRHVEILEPITHHVIFDDDGDFHPDQPLVQTSWESGIQHVHITRARQILKYGEES